MKVVILAAGRGTRLAPFTDKVAKVLVPILGKPFLSYVLDHLIDAGYNDIGVVVGYRKEQIIDFVTKKYVRRGEISVTFCEQSELRGTGDAVCMARLFCGGEPFVVVSGDGLLSVRDFKRLGHGSGCDGGRDDSFCYIMGKEVTEPKRYGILKVKSGFLVEVVEKPQEFIGTLASPGMYLFTSEIWPQIERLRPSARGEIEITDAINVLAGCGKVKVLRVQDYWLDLGKKEDIGVIEKVIKKVLDQKKRG